MQSIATECGSAPSLRAESLDKGHNEVSWDIVEVGLNTGDETGNFGPRREKGVGLYQVETLASIGTNDALQSASNTPNVVLKTSPRGAICTLVGNQVHVFDAGCTTLLSTLNLGGAAELATWSADGSFLVVATSLGVIHFVDVKTKRVLFSQELFKYDGSKRAFVALDLAWDEDYTTSTEVSRSGSGELGDDDGDTATDSESSASHCGVHRLVALSTSGRLFHFANIDLGTLRKAISTGDVATAGTVRAGIKVAHADVTTEHDATIHGALPVCIGGVWCILTWGAGKSALCLWHLSTRVATTPTTGSVAEVPTLRHAVRRLLRGEEIISGKITPDARLVTLSANGQLAMWMLPELILLSRGPSNIRSFELFQSAADSANDIGEIDDGQCTKSKGSASGSAKQVRVAALADLPMDAGFTTDTASTGAAFVIMTLLGGFEELYQLEVEGDGTALANIVDQDNLHIAEYKPAKDSLHDGGMEFQLRCLSPTLPTNRFYHLLHRQRFDEAMQLAQMFGLDVEMVHRVRVTSLLDAADKDPTLPNLLEDLKESLAFVDDDELVVDSCLQASLASVATTKDILTFGLQRLEREQSPKSTGAVLDQTTGSGLDASEVATLRTRLHNAIKRLSSYELAVEGATFNAPEWHHFRSVDLCRELVNCLVNGRFATAQVIWTRHATEYDLPSEITSILSSIAEHFPIQEYIGWLARDVFPSALPPQRTFVLEWINGFARSLELCQKEAWPMNALDLIAASKTILQAHGYGAMTSSAASRTFATTPGSDLDSLFGRCDDTEDLNYSNSTDDMEACIRDLMLLKEQLEDVAYLREHLGIFVSLSTYTSETPSSLLAQYMEKVVAPELVAGVIEKDLKPYLQRHGLELDAFLLDYLRDFMGNVGGVMSQGLSGSAWEAKAITIIISIQNYGLRTEAVLELMRRASVPCSKEVKALIDGAMEKTSSRSSEITEQYRIMELRAMLQTYGIKQFNLTDLSLVRGLLQHIVSRDDVPTALDDALALVSAYHHLLPQEAYVGRLQYLTTAGNTCDISAIVDSLPPACIVAVTAEFMFWIDGVLCERSYIPEDDATKRRCIDAGLAFMETVVNTDHQGIHFSQQRTASASVDGASVVAAWWDTLTRFKSLHALVTEFDTVVNPAVFTCDVEREALVVAQLALICSLTQPLTVDGTVTRTDKAHDTLPVSQYHRFCRFLDIVRANRGRTAVALAALRARGDLSDAEATVAVRLCVDVCVREGMTCKLNSSAEMAYVQHEVAKSLLQMTSDPLREQLPEILARHLNMAAVFDLSRAALLFCHKAHIADYLELARGCELAHMVFRQCEGGEYEEVVSQSAPTSACDATLSERFKEDGLVLDSATAIPMATAFIQATMPDAFVGGYVGNIGWHPSVRLAGQAATAAAASSTALALVSRKAQDMVKYLSENNLGQAALRYAVGTVGVCTQHYALSPDVVKPVYKAVLPRAVTVIQDVAQTILGKVLTAPSLDRKMAIGYITMLDLKAGFMRFRKAIAATKKNYGRLAELALVGMGFAKLWAQEGFLSECHTLRTNATWWAEFDRLGVVFDRKEFEAAPQVTARKLLPALLLQMGNDMDVVDSFAKDYGVDEETLVEHLIPFLLQLQSPQQATKLQRQYEPQSTPPLGYQSLIYEAIDRIDDKSRVVSVLERVHKTVVGPYDYEKLKFVFDLAVELQSNAEASSIGIASWAQTGQMLLEVMWHYKRLNPPSPYEIQFLEENMATDGNTRVDRSDSVAAAIVKQRLPFHVLVYGDPLQVLTPELTLATVATLCPLAKLLPGDFKPDDFIVTLIQRELRNDDASLPSLQDIRPIFDRIQDEETAIMTAKLMADRYALGEAKLDAWELAVHRASDWMAAEANDVKREEIVLIHARLLKLYHASVTEYSLMKTGLAFAGVQEVLETPAELIKILYYNNLISTSDNPKQLSDLHDVAEDIASRYELDCDRIRRGLLQKWISEPTEAGGSRGVEGGGNASPEMGTGTDSPLSLAGLLDDEEDDDEAEEGAGVVGKSEADRWCNSYGQTSSTTFYYDDNLNRAVVLLRHSPSREIVEFLVNYIFTAPPSVKVTPNGQQRAFQALISVVTPQEVMEVSGKPLEDIRYHLLALHYIQRLAALSVQQTVPEFVQANKEGLIRSIWRDHHHDDAAVILVADMCIDYFVYDATLWGKMLQAMVDTRLWAELARFLRLVSGVPELWLLPDLPRVWQSTLEALQCKQQKQAEAMATSKGSSTKRRKQFALDKERFVELLLRSPFLLDNGQQTVAAKFMRAVAQGEEGTPGDSVRSGVPIFTAKSLSVYLRTYLLKGADHNTAAASKC